jgi:NADPH2:quinone reductase
MDACAPLPGEMTAIFCDSAGGPEVLVPRRVPVQRPGPGQVLIHVAHAGVNRPDIVQREGKYPPPPGASEIPGLEIAGTIVALGEGATGLHLDDQVCALVTGGGYAEYCVAEAGHCLPVPGTLDLAEAAALPETLFTVWHNVFQRGLAADGDRLLVHGGTSGIGTMAIMLSRLFGVETIVTCGSDEKCEQARQIGASHAINYRNQDFVAEVKRITDGRGVDVVLDMVSGDYAARNIDCLAAAGRHVTIAVMGGARAEVNMAKLMTRRLTLTGSTLRPRSAEFKTALADDIRRNVWPLVQSGQLRPVMDARFALKDAAEAHRRMESGHHVGKIVLDIM